MRLRAALVLLAVAAATPEMQYFRYERGLAVQATPQVRQTCAALDAGIYAHAAPGLADLRLYHGRVETPYTIREAALPQGQLHILAPLNLGLRDGQAVFDAAMPEGSYSDIELDITGKDFLATVSVSGSQEQSGAATKLGAYTIFDLTSQKLGRSTVLHLPETDFRYLHFRIAGPVTPEQIGGLSVERLPTKRQYVTVTDINQITQKGHESVIEFKAPAHVPLDRIEFLVGAEPVNFSRFVTVKATPIPTEKQNTDEEPPQPVIASGNLLRLHATPNGHRIDEEHLAVDAPWVGFGDLESTWTVSVDNGDDAPLAITDVKLEMAERRLCFDAAAGASYTLMYGDAALAAPRYDYATLFAPEADAAVASLGPETGNPQYQARPDTRPFTERHPGLLWAALIIVVAVLGVVAVRTAKETKA